MIPMITHDALALPLKTPGRNFWKSVSSKTEEAGGSYDLLYQNSIRKYEDDLEHQFISIWYDYSFSRFDGFSYNFVNNIYQIVWH